MEQIWGQLSLLVIAACALSGWWLAVRPRSTYRGASPTMSCLIMIMAILMCVLAISAQTGPRAAFARTAAPVPYSPAVP